MTEKMIIDAYCRIRTIDNTIPDDVLDFMKNSAIEKFQNIEQKNKKDYEILSIVKISKDGFGEILSDKESVDAFLEGYGEKTWAINSIKRLSDREVFTLNDKIKGKSGLICEIDEIWINPAQPLQVMFNHLDEGIDLNNAKPILLTTEDGVDIYKGETYWIVDKLDFRIGEKIVKMQMQESYLNFSTKEKAEEYVIYNKPFLSLKSFASFVKDKDMDNLNKIIRSELLKL
jgi:hypothetical protein